MYDVIFYTQKDTYYNDNDYTSLIHRKCII